MTRVLGRNINWIVLAALAIGIFSSSATAQYKGTAVKKEKLVNVLKSRQLQTREIVAVIKSNGVDFEVDGSAESELVAAGARPEVIAAAKANYRAPAIAAKAGPPSKFTGQPLTKDAIVTLLQNRVADLQVRKNVQQRGVNFKPTAIDKADIKKAGGSVALVTLIEGSYAVQSAPTPAPIDPGGGGGSDKYNNLIDKAVVQYDTSKDTTGAITTLQDAVKADPTEARAYQQLGYMYLYGQKNFTEAEKYMKLAIERGGSAVFRVFHDHDGFFNTTCQGSLFIARDTVRFESDDNKHTFETPDESIKSIKMNNAILGLFKTKSGSFNFKLKTGETESKNYNFAPLTDNALESKIIIRLIGK